jgi:ElaB/YqjD/DUF883 family membrane-anchored ribosome-binding protein
MKAEAYMSSTYGSSSTQGSTRDAVRDTVKDARDAARESAQAVSEAGSNMQADLDSLRQEVRRLTDQITGILTAKGSAAWTRARSNIEGAVSDATAKGQEAVHAVREVGDTMVEAIDDSLKKRPYTTLAIAVGIGFLFGATWRR